MHDFGKHSYELLTPPPVVPVGVTLTLHLDIEALDELLAALDGKGIFNGAWYTIRDAAREAHKQGAPLTHWVARG